MAFLSDFLATEIADHILGTTSYTMPASFTSLHSNHPGETGVNELAGGGYARQATAFVAAVTGAADNSALEVFTNLQGAPNEIGFIGVWDASTAGNFLWFTALGGTPFTFTATNAGDVFTSYGHTLVNDNRLFLTPWPGSALPAGPTADTVYYVVGVSGNTFQISTTQGGAAVVLTSDGEGIAYLVSYRTYNNGDRFEIPVGDLNFALD